MNRINADSIDFSSINDICISHSISFHFDYIHFRNIHIVINYIVIYTYAHIT